MARKGGLTRKELTEKDEITSTLEWLTRVAVEHGQVIGAVVAAGVVVVAAVVLWNFYSARVEAVSQEALASVFEAFNNLEGRSDEERFNRTIAEARRVQTDHAGTRAADIARYYEALSQDGLGNASAAEQIFLDLIASGDTTIRDTARFALAESFKKRNDFEAAIAELETLAESPSYSRGAVLYELGRLHEGANRPDDAQSYYETLIAEYPESPYRADADRALRRLEAVNSQS